MSESGIGFCIVFILSYVLSLLWAIHAFWYFLQSKPGIAKLINTPHSMISLFQPLLHVQFKIYFIWHNSVVAGGISTCM